MTLACTLLKDVRTTLHLGPWACWGWPGGWGLWFSVSRRMEGKGCRPLQALPGEGCGHTMRAELEVLLLFCPCFSGPWGLGAVPGSPQGRAGAGHLESAFPSPASVPENLPLQLHTCHCQPCQSLKCGWNPELCFCREEPAEAPLPASCGHRWASGVLGNEAGGVRLLRADRPGLNSEIMVLGLRSGRVLGTSL